MKHLVIDFKEKPFHILEDKDIIYVEEFNRLIIDKVGHIDIKDGYVKVYFRRSQNINIELDLCKTISID